MARLMIVLVATTLLLLPLPGHVHAFLTEGRAKTGRLQSSSPASVVSLNGWQFRGHDVYTESFKPDAPQLSISSNPFTDLLNIDNKSTKKKPVIVLIHGFGCSTTYWRKTKEFLGKDGYEVHALDLLGQGQSSKPGRADGIEYSIRLWAEQIDTYIREFIESDQPIVLCGNSLGSLVALSAATGDFREEEEDSATALPTNNNNNYQGICMFNCGVGLNALGIANEEQWNDFQRFLIRALYNILALLIFRNTLLLTYILNNVVTKDFLRESLQSLYKCTPSNVDDELVDSFYLPAKDDGSVEALSQIYTNDPGTTPMQLHRDYEEFIRRQLAIHLVWGDEDAVTPLEGGVGQFYYKLAQDPSSRVSFETISPSGHFPFDDNPEDSNQSLLAWLGTLG